MCGACGCEAVRPFCYGRYLAVIIYFLARNFCFSSRYCKKASGGILDFVEALRSLASEREGLT